MAMLCDGLNKPLAGEPPFSSMPAAPQKSDEFRCRWDNCGTDFATGEELYNHLCTDHVIRRPKHVIVASNAAEAARRQPAPAHSGGGGSDEPLRLHCHWERCNVMVQKRDHMTSHIRIHINMKPYACNRCEKKFKRTQDLKKHLRTHPESALAAPLAQPEAPVSDSTVPLNSYTPHRPCEKRNRERRLNENVKRPCPGNAEQQGDEQQGQKEEQDWQQRPYQQVHGLQKTPPQLTSDPDKQCAVKESLKLLADVHSSQVKPEFSESLAERLNTISLILRDEKVLQFVSEKVTKSYPNTSEQLGELNEFLEQVSENITEQQMSMRVKQEEQPLSEIVYNSMKPIFPSLPFEAGTEADFVSGPNYFPEVLEASHPVDIQQYLPQSKQLQEQVRIQGQHLTAPPQRNMLDEGGNTGNANYYPMMPQYSHGSDLAFERLFADGPTFWGNSPPSREMQFAPPPEVPEDREVTNALDIYLSQMENQMAAEHTLEVTSGLRNLINEAIDPDQSEVEEDQVPQHFQYHYSRQPPPQQSGQQHERQHERQHAARYNMGQHTSADSFPQHQHQHQHQHQLFTRKRAAFGETRYANL